MLEDEKLEFQPSPFFNEQLTAFELWLEHGSNDKKPPEQLPIVLQVSTVHCSAHLKVHLLSWQLQLATSFSKTLTSSECDNL